jgi:hypothetical protein
MGLGILFALFAGNYVAEEDYTPIAIVLGSLLAITLVFSVGSNAYLLILYCWPLIGSIYLLPLPFNIRQLAIIFAGIIFVSGIIFKIGGGKKVPFDMLDLWVWINVVYLVTVFFRNPVGINALGGDRVGGRPYVDVILGVAAYLILRRETISSKVAVLIPIVWLCAEIFNAIAGMVAIYLPQIGSKIGMIYSVFLPSVNSDIADSSNGNDRLESLQTAGATLVLYICCILNPTHLIRPHNYIRLSTYMLGVISVMLSGFRNALFKIILITAASALLREKFIGVVKIFCIVIVCALTGVLFSYSNISLPWTFQRTLSFLPGNWDPTAVKDAADSSEWRFEMWKVVLSSDKYIHNKVFGDGFGFMRSDYDMMIDTMRGAGQGFGGENAGQEAFMLNGDFHNGPISTIRFVGYLGLILFIPLMFLLAIRFLEVIRNTHGTPFQFFGLFFGIPMLVFPFWYIIIFGDYRSDLITIIFYSGVVKMLSASLFKYKNISKNKSVSNYI